MHKDAPKLGLLRNWWDRQIRLPIAGIAAFRMAVGAGLFITFAHLWQYADCFLVPDRGRFHLSEALSLFDLLPSVLWVKAMLLLGMLAALGLSLNYWSKAAALFLLLLNLSIYAKAAGFLTGGDTLATILLAWSLFLPAPTMAGYRSIVCLAMSWQVMVMYFSSMLSKLKDSYWLMGDTVGINLACFMWETRLGRWYGYHFPAGIHRFATHLTIVAEGSLLLACLSPFGQPYLRRASIALLILFHIGTALTMQLGAFPIYMIGFLLMLLDPAAWAWLASRGGFSFPQFQRKSALERSEATPWPFGRDSFRFDRRLLMQAARGLCITFFLIAFGAELWNEVAGSRNSRLWVHTPWRRVMSSWIGYNQNWSMFSLSDTQRPRKEKENRIIWTSVPVVLIRATDGTLWEPMANRPVRTEADWAQAFLTRQGRDSWLGKAAHVTTDTNFQINLGNYYARLARSKHLQVAESLIYNDALELHLPSRFRETYAQLNSNLTAWVERRATVAFDGTGRFTGYERGHGSAAPIPIPTP